MFHLAHALAFKSITDGGQENPLPTLRLAEGLIVFSALHQPNIKPAKSAI